MKSIYKISLALVLPLTMSAQIPGSFKELIALSDSLDALNLRLEKGELERNEYNALTKELLSQISSLAYTAYQYAEEDQMEEPVFEVGEPSDAGMGSDTIPEDFGMPEMSGGRSPMGLLAGNKKRTSLKIRYGMYWNGLSAKNEVSSISYPKFNTWSSYSWFGSFDLLLNTRLGKNDSPFSLYYGIGWDNRCFAQKKNVLQLRVDNDKANFVDPANKLDKAQIELGFFRFPLGVQFKKNKFAINIGTYLGLMTNHSQSLEYKTADGEDAELILDKNYDFTKTNYGLSASIGYKRLHLGINYDLNKFFKNSEDFEYNAWRIGLLIF